MPALPLTVVADGVIVTIKLTPKSGRDAIDAVVQDAGPRGPEAVLRARVSAAPDDGRANAALIGLLSAAWDLPRRDLTVISGATSRTKRVLVRGDGPRLRARLAARMPGR